MAFRCFHFGAALEDGSGKVLKRDYKPGLYAQFQTGFDNPKPQMEQIREAIKNGQIKFRV